MICLISNFLRLLLVYNKKSLKNKYLYYESDLGMIYNMIPWNEMIQIFDVKE